ncbi:receptor-type tyrosine-protein phosphatase S-like [Strongylocentrotus purpuratus]|uniref:protein-tyrosine-phosphatase n=1 Tax=Strongylocentrotus purpuratus TaxID=7668 RepID=A0A7M7NPI4_STRPU|nr:receptor-type tyrosine-protein phosphatase S-like [Strongylocentrotus purpuratus]
MEQWKIDCVAVVVLATVLVLTIGQSAASPPVITLGLTDESGIDEGAATFYCKATGDPAPTFEWYGNKKRVRGLRYQIVETEGGSVLRITPLRLDRDNDLAVVCEASNDDGTATTQARLTVTQADSLPAGYPETSNPRRYMVVENNQPATIYCGATGNPEPEILWFKEFVPIETNDRISITDSGLQFSRVLLSDQGRYECAAKNSLGTRYSAEAQVYVKDRRVEPRFTILPVNQEVVPGGSVNLTCAAYGSPMPRVRWMKADMDLDDMDGLPIGRNVLQLRDIYESGNYTCVATSLLGTIETLARVTVRTRPSVPNSPVVTGYTSSSLTVEWSTLPSDTVTSHVLEYKPSRSGGSFTEVEIPSEQGTFFTIEGLLPYTEYAVRLLAVNTIGRSNPSAEATAMTGEDVVGPALYFVDCSGTNPCLNGGTCESESCTCAPGFSGDLCDSVVCPVVTATAPDDLEQKICDSDNIFIVKMRPDGRAKILDDLTHLDNPYAVDRPIIGFITNDVCNLELAEKRYMLFMAGEAVPGKKFTLDLPVLVMSMTGHLKVQVKEIRLLCPVA